jgi:hypothetical protein
MPNRTQITKIIRKDFDTMELLNGGQIDKIIGRMFVLKDGEYHPKLEYIEIRDRELVLDWEKAFLEIEEAA